MPRLIAALIRHADYHQLADTPSAHQPFPLTAEGERQAQQAAGSIAETLNRENWQLAPDIDSSLLLRAWQTAQILAGELVDRFPRPATIRGYEALAERGLGSANNLSISQIEDVIKADPRFLELPTDWKSNSHFRLPLQGAESLMQAGVRVAGHLRQQMEAMAAQGAGGSSDSVKLFVGHGAAIRHAAHHLGVLTFEQIARLSMFHATPVYLEFLPGGEWLHVAGEWKVRAASSAYTD